MAQEYFLARDENGLHLFGNKPRLRRKTVSPIHWEWIDEEGRHGFPIMNCDDYTNNIRQVPLNSYIKLIDFGEDIVFSPLRQIEHEHNINSI
jgi:hypothetical protein